MVQSKQLLAPAILFAAGSFAGSANAAVFVANLDLTAGPNSKFAIGVPIADAQFDFSVEHFFPFKTNLTGNGTGGVFFEGGPAYTPYIPDGTDSFDMSVKTDGKPGYYGLRFQAGSDTYFGYATVDNGGSHISQVAYEAPSALSVSTSVPEPATWAEMILGLGVAGAAMRRRRQSAALSA